MTEPPHLEYMGPLVAVVRPPDTRILAWLRPWEVIALYENVRRECVALRDAVEAWTSAQL